VAEMIELIKVVDRLSRYDWSTYLRFLQSVLMKINISKIIDGDGG
jgi:hypothetical protein